MKNNCNHENQISKSDGQNHVYFEDLKWSQRRRLRQEFDGFSMGILWFIVYFFALAMIVAGYIIFIIFVLSSIKQNWQFSGMFVGLTGTFVLQTMMQMIASKQKNLFKMLETKRKIVLFFVAAGLLVVQLVFVISFIIKPTMWIHWTSLSLNIVWVFIYLVPYAVSTNKTKNEKNLSIKQQTQAQQNNFVKWLKTEKNILSKVCVIDNTANSVACDDIFKDIANATNTSDDVSSTVNSTDNSDKSADLDGGEVNNRNE